MTRARCSNCCYFHRTDGIEKPDENVRGECRVDNPQWVRDWPLPRMDDWCGRHPAFRHEELQSDPLD